MGKFHITMMSGTLRWYRDEAAPIPGRYDFSTGFTVEGYADHIMHIHGADNVPKDVFSDRAKLAANGFDWATWERYDRDPETGRLSRDIIWLRLVRNPRPKYDEEAA